MSDVEFSGPGKNFHRRSARKLKGCVCGDDVNQPTSSICVRPGNGGLVLGGPFDTCWQCLRSTYTKTILATHNLDQTFDDAADGLYDVYTQTVGNWFYEYVFWYRSFREMSIDPAPLEYDSQCHWNYSGVVSWDYTTNISAADPIDAVQLSNFVKRYDASTDIQQSVFFAQLIRESSTLFPYGFRAVNTLATMSWRRATNSLNPNFPELAIDVHYHNGSDEIRLAYHREVNVPQAAITTVCGNPPTFVITGDYGVTLTPVEGGA